MYLTTLKNEKDVHKLNLLKPKTKVNDAFIGMFNPLS